MSTSAQHVASLLRQRSSYSSGAGEKDTLVKLTRDVELFLRHAADVPPVVMETPQGGMSPSSGECNTDSTVEVQLNVVAGVLEPREMTDGVAALDGVLLPTAENRAALDRQRLTEAQAMLNLASALTATKEAGQRRGDTRSADGGEKEGGDDDDDDDYESVAVFDAADLENDTSSDDDDDDYGDGEGNAHKQLPSRIVELN
ncbi:hypothetical protein DQ04_00211260 [Trypanosoma grayi]|uniref:hypothetical protein n=1 Tax=Trypanosoma grayi TaxID=71804 RepID=UPI0004F4AAB7|nr:hypothetical protein DQ04_00211260 [Trypanosoma grayi]KEG15043.1 hypothetical protein DQ04_00211260 [Trypanosoma grayi]